MGGGRRATQLKLQKQKSTLDSLPALIVCASKDSRNRNDSVALATTAWLATGLLTTNNEGSSRVWILRLHRRYRRMWMSKWRDRLSDKDAEEEEEETVCSIWKRDEEREAMPVFVFDLAFVCLFDCLCLLWWTKMQRIDSINTIKSTKYKFLMEDKLFVFNLCFLYCDFSAIEFALNL